MLLVDGPAPLLLPPYPPPREPWPGLPTPWVADNPTCFEVKARRTSWFDPKSYLMCGTPTSICGSGVLAPSNRSCKIPVFVIWGLAFVVHTPSASSRGRLCSRVFGAAWSGTAHAALT